MIAMKDDCDKILATSIPNDLKGLLEFKSIVSSLLGLISKSFKESKDAVHDLKFASEYLRKINNKLMEILLNLVELQNRIISEYELLPSCEYCNFNGGKQIKIMQNKYQEPE